MSEQKTDFARLVRLQRVLKAMRERDHAEAKFRAVEADLALTEISDIMDNAGPIASLFPDLLAGYFQRAIGERADAEKQAEELADRLIEEKKRLEQIENRLGQQKTEAMRKAEEKAQAEALDQRYSRPVPVSSKIGRVI
jgi:ParB-like chromosome segregation protein Spo0J